MRRLTALMLILALLLCGCATEPSQTSVPASSSVISPSAEPSAQPSDEQLPTERAKEIEELLRYNCTLGGEQVYVSVFNIEDGEGRPFDTVHPTQGYSDWDVKKIEDFAPEFAVEPSDLRVAFLDVENGMGESGYSTTYKTADTSEPGEYRYNIRAEYETDDGYRAYMEYSGTVTVHGEPILTLDTDMVSQGDLLPVATNGWIVGDDSAIPDKYGEYPHRMKSAIDSFDYELYLPHTDSTQPMVARDGDRLYAVAQISVAAEPGDYTMELRRSKDGGDPEVIATADYHIEAREFDRQDLVTSSSTQSIYTSSNLNSDNEKMRAARSDSNPQPYFKGLFSCPLPDGWVLTTEFGQQRYVAGKFQSRHAARDMAAPLGTDVYATAPGKVTFAGELIVSGNTVVIDHGAGIFSSYSHLNEIGVEEGDFVEQGATIGKVGSTGYSTGPHLHFGLVASGYYVDPLYPQEHDLLAVLNPSEE